MMSLSEEQIQALIKLGSSQVELGQLRQADKSFQTLLKYMPAHPDALFGLAEIARRQRKPRKQQAWLEELVSVHPQHLAGVMALARLLGESQPELALPYLERALEARPGQAELLLETAACLQRAGEYDRSRAFLEQLTRQQAPAGSAAIAWLLMARLHMRSGELPDAAKAFERAAELDPAIRSDPRWVDLDARWQQLEARADSLDWQAIEKRMGGTK
ncbi:MAG: tetratricopeptide repeat protein [Candidatus Sericytochromatia bacterium]